MSTTTASAAPRARYIPHLGVMLAIQSLVSICAASIPVLATAIAPDAGVRAADVGIYTMILYACGMVSAMVGGAMVQRFGAIRISQACLLLAAVGLLLAVTGHVVGLLLCAFVFGIGMGAPTPASSHLLARVTPPRRLSLVFSIKQTGVPLGGALAGAILPLLTLQFGWRGALGIAAAACTIALLLLQLVRTGMDDDREPTRRITLPGIWSTLGLVWREPDLRLIALAAAIFSAGQVCVSAFYVTYLVQSVGLALTGAGFALATAQMSGVFGRVAWGAVADWCGRPLLVYAGLACVAAAAMIAASQLEPGGPLWPVHVVSFVLGTTTIGWAGIAYAEVARRAPPGRGAEVSGGMTSMMFAGIVVGPAIFGAIVRATGSFTIAFIAIALALAAISAALVLRLVRGGAG